MRPLLAIARRCGGWLVLMLLVAGGCRPPPPGPLVKAGMYGESPQELARLWGDILVACQRDDRPRVHDLMASFIMTQPELSELIGPSLAPPLWARYQAMLGSLVNIGAVGLVAHVYEKKYDDIVVTRVDNQVAPEQADTDSNIVRALQTPRPFYTVRVKKKTEKSGLRYDFFIYMNGYWRSGNLLGKFLPAAPVVAPADGGLADSSPPVASPAIPSVAPAKAAAKSPATVPTTAPPAVAPAH